MERRSEFNSFLAVDAYHLGTTAYYRTKRIGSLLTTTAYTVVCEVNYTETYSITTHEIKGMVKDQLG